MTIPEQLAANYGKKCRFEKLVKAGSFEHNGYRYEHIIPWNSTEDAWVPVKTRITGSTIELFEQQQTRNLVIEP